jgi:galactokinase/mevalonate kinase-like predicted kinase
MLATGALGTPSGASIVMSSGGGGGGFQFCIFRIRVKFNVSKRFRKIDEWVLYFIHYCRF